MIMKMIMILTLKIILIKIMILNRMINHNIKNIVRFFARFKGDLYSSSMYYQKLQKKTREKSQSLSENEKEGKTTMWSSEV